MSPLYFSPHLEGIFCLFVGNQLSSYNPMMSEKTFKPTESMAAAARRGLKMRDSQPDSNKGGTSVGLARARQLASKEPLSLDTVKRMYSFFSRHEVDKSSESWKDGDSKGEQAWLLWGGDAGYSWSRKIVESEKKSMKANKIVERDGRWYVTGKDGSGNLGKKEGYSTKEEAEKRLREIEYFKTNVLLTTNVNKSQIKDTGSHWEIKSIPITVDNAVMNGIYYPAKENAAGLPSLIGKPVSLGHPIDSDGNFISGREGEGMTEFFSGGTITNVYNMNGTNYADAKIKKSILEAQEKGGWYKDTLNSRGEIGVSTGLSIPENTQSGVAPDSTPYSQTAIMQQYDHLAMLEPGEAPAGGDATFMRFNSAENINVCNVDEHMPKESDLERFMSVCKAFFTGNKEQVYNDDENGLSADDDLTNNGEVPSVDRKKMMALMKNMGMDMKEVENMDDDKMYNAMMEYSKNMGKKSNADNTDDKEKMEKEEMDKEKMKSNSAETPEWAKSLMATNQELMDKVNNLEAKQVANADAEKANLVEAAKKIGILSTEEIGDLSVNSLKSHVATHGGHLNVNAAGGYAPANNAEKDSWNLVMPNSEDK